MSTIDAPEVIPARAPASSIAETARERRADFLSTMGTTAILLLPAGLTVMLSFKAGSFFPGTTALAAVVLTAAAACCLAVARHPFAGLSRPSLFIAVALGLFAGWTLLSAQWSHAPGRALLSYDRVLVYAMTFAIFASMKRTEQRVRVLLYGLAAGCVVVCTAALISRTLPHVLAPGAPTNPPRLAYPLTYWNTLGLLAGLGVILCGHLTCSAREPRTVRVLAATAAPVLATTLFLTFSRGDAWATVIGVLAYLLIARPPGAVPAGLSTLPPLFVSLLVVNPPSALTSFPNAAATIARGERQAAVLLGCALVAGTVRAALLPLDHRLACLHVGLRTRRLIALGTTVVVATGLTVIVVSGEVSHIVRQQVAQFQSTGSSGGGLTRLVSGSGNGRTNVWQVAIDAFRASPLHGSGAGTYVIDWDRRRDAVMTVLNAHSLYFETLAELGIVGFVLLATVLVGIIVGCARAARGAQPPLYAVLFGAALAWMLAAGADWDWQMPAVTLWLFAAGGLALAAPAETRPSLPRVRRWARIPALAACGLLALAPVEVLGAEGHINRAVAAANAGHCRTANIAARAATSTVRSLPGPAIVLAYCAIRQGHPTTAIGPLRGALASDPSNWELWYDLGVVRVSAGLPALSQALTAQRLNPLDPNLGILMATISAISAARHEPALAALRSRDLGEQDMLSALPSRTARQNRRLAALEALTPKQAEELAGLRTVRQHALIALMPLTP